MGVILLRCAQSDALNDLDIAETLLNLLRAEVYFGHHNVKIMKILEVYPNTSTLVLIVKLLRRAFEGFK
jgi:hypothetical protein